MAGDVASLAAEMTTFCYLVSMERR